MNSISRLNRVTLPCLFGWCVLTFCVMHTTDAADPYLVLVSEKTTLSIQLKFPEGAEPELRSAAYTDSKSEKLEVALLTLLDSDRDGVLNAGDLSGAELLLERLDYDEDECLAPLELANDLLTARSPMKAMPKFATVLIHSKADAQAIDSLRKEIERFGRPVMTSLDSVDAIVVLAEASQDSVQVTIPDGATVHVTKFHSPTGTTRWLLMKDDLTVDLSAEQPSSDSVNINVRPGRSGLFEWLDVDGDNKLSRVELRAATKSGLGQLVHSSARPFENSVAIWLGNGTRQPASIALLPIGSGANRQQGKTLDWFGATDSNRDGVISINEFLSGDSQFQDLDGNRDGLLTREEAETK